MYFKIYILFFLSCLSVENFSAQNDFEPVAVIELFSSQGCSSCPPADALLSKTIAKNNKKIFALSFHVDYWNRLGWKDPFSDKKFSERQQNYSQKMQLNSSYTPQMIVNGINEFVGSDETKLTKSMAEALNAKSEVAFENVKLSSSESTTTLHYELKGNYENSVINIAVVSLKEVTSIKRGENTGLTITNEHVVRQFFSKDALVKNDITFTSIASEDKSNWAVIAYVQKKSSLKITGAIQLTER